MADLRTNYQDDVLDASKNTARVYDLVDSNGTVVLAGVHLEDKTVYTTEGDDYGAADINTQNGKINELSNDLTELNNEIDITTQLISGYIAPSQSFVPIATTDSISKYKYLDFMILYSNTVYDIKTVPRGLFESNYVTTRYSDSQKTMGVSFHYDSANSISVGTDASVTVTVNYIVIGHN